LAKSGSLYVYYTQKIQIGRNFFQIKKSDTLLQNPRRFNIPRLYSTLDSLFKNIDLFQAQCKNRVIEEEMNSLRGKVKNIYKMHFSDVRPLCGLDYNQTPEGYISKDIYIPSYIQKSPKRIFSILF
jgi:hypothetical protein